MREKLYCEKCDKMVDYEIIEKKEIFKVRGEDIEIISRVAICKECGNELSEPSLEDENFTKAFRIYARRHSLLLPEEIKVVREHLGLSQEDFARMLGISKKALARYEDGALIPEALSERIKNMIQQKPLVSDQGP